MKISKLIYIELLAISIILMQVIGRETLELANSLYYPMIIMGALLLFFIYLKYKISQGQMFCVAAYIFLSLVNVLFVKTSTLDSIALELMVYVPLGLYFAINTKYTPNLWYIMCLFIAYFVMQHWFSSADGYNLFPGMGRNYVSVYSIILVFILSVVMGAMQKKVPIGVFILAFIFSVMAVGRTGIIATLLMLIAIILYRTFEKNGGPNLKRLLRILVICLVLGIAVIYVFVNFETILQTYFPRFAGKESSAALSNVLRLQMFQDYINMCTHNIEGLILGINPSLISIFSGNLHNSYFQLHSATGIVWIGWILHSIVKYAYKEIREKNFELLISVSCFLFRAFMDWCFPAFLGSVIIWFIIFSSTKEIEIIKSKDYEK